MPKKRNASRPAPQPSAERVRFPAAEPDATTAAPPTEQGAPAARPSGLVVPRRVAARYVPTPEEPAAPAEQGRLTFEPAPSPGPALAPEPEPASAPERSWTAEPTPEPEPEPAWTAESTPEPLAEPEPEPAPQPVVEPEDIPAWRPAPFEIATTVEPAPAPDLEPVVEPEPASETEWAAESVPEPLPEPAWTIQPAHEPESVAEFERAEETEPPDEPGIEHEPTPVEPKRGLLARMFKRREEPLSETLSGPDMPDEAEAAPDITEVFSAEPITPELIAFLEEPEVGPAAFEPSEDAPAGIAEADETPVAPVFGYGAPVLPQDTAPFAFVPSPEVVSTAQASLAEETEPEVLAAAAEETASDTPTATPEEVGWEASMATLPEVEPDDSTIGVVDWADHVTEFGTRGSVETTPVQDDWLASRDEPTTVPLSAWIAPPKDEPSTPVTPELPLPAAEAPIADDWWPQVSEGEDSSGALFVEDDWWSQSRMGSARTRPPAPEDDWASETLFEDAPEAELLPEAASRAQAPDLREDLIPIAGAPTPPVERVWGPEDEATLELFEELEAPTAPTPAARPERGRPRREPRRAEEAPEAEKVGKRRKEAAPRKGGDARRAPKAEVRAEAEPRPREKGRSWWPFVLTIVAVLVALFVLVALGARLGTAALWEAVVPGEEAATSPEEYSYVLPTWPIFGAAPVSATTSPPVSVVATSSGGATVTVELDPVIEAALPYPDAPSVQPVVIRRLTPKHRYVAITLDDGIPFDTRLLELFRRYDARGTTFVLGQFATTRPELVDRLQESGFEIANHSWDHKDLSKLPESEVRSELSRTQAAISAVTGNQAPYMRPPGGAYNSKTVDIAASMGYRVVMWNRSLADTSPSATPEQLYHNAVDNVQAGDIILCHWGRPHTYDAMVMILPELQRRGFQVVTLSELIADSGGVGALD